MANMTNSLAPIDLSTAERVEMQRDIVNTGDARTDLVGAMIAEVSSAFCEYLSMHLLRATRTEVYELRRFSKLVTLDAVDVSTTGLVVKVASDPTGLATATALTIGTDFSLNARTGVLRLLDVQPYAPAYVEVTYTGGLFTDATELGMKHTWITTAADTQIVYRLTRQDSLGGNVSSSAGSTNYQGAYDFLPRVESTLRAHRRAHV